MSIHGALVLSLTQTPAHASSSRSIVSLLPWAIVVASVGFVLGSKQLSRQRQVQELTQMNRAFKQADRNKDMLAASADVRMTQHIYSAQLFMRYNENASFVTEINRACEENDVCQTSIIPANLPLRDRHDVYRAAMRYNVERNETFSYKLQMRKILAVSDDDGERLDFEAKQGTGSFNI